MTAARGELVFVREAGRSFVFHAPTARFFATSDIVDGALRVAAEVGAEHGESLAPAIAARLSLPQEDAAELARSLRELGLLAGLPAEKGPVLAPSVARLKLHVSGICNLSCGYCYQGASSGKPSRFMTEARARESVDWLFAENPDEASVEVMFFGGEPLLNFPVVEAAARHARARGEREGRKVELSMISNGTLLTAERARILGELGVGVGLSIDGAPDHHNKRRVFTSGQGSYQQTMRAFRLLTEASCRAHALVTISRHNNDAWRIVHHLLGEGFPSVVVTPVASSSAQAGLDAAGYDKLASDMCRLADHYADEAAHGRQFGFSNIRTDVLAVRQARQKHYPCSAGLSSAACSPEGQLYLCHRFSDRPEYRIGDVDQGLDSATIAAFREQMHLHERTDCAKCWARHLCGGGCHQHNELDNGDMRRTTAARCDFLRAWYAKVLSVYARILSDNPGYWG